MFRRNDAAAPMDTAPLSAEIYTLFKPQSRNHGQGRNHNPQGDAIARIRRIVS